MWGFCRRALCFGLVSFLKRGECLAAAMPPQPVLVLNVLGEEEATTKTCTEPPIFTDDFQDAHVALDCTGGLERGSFVSLNPCLCPSKPGSAIDPVALVSGEEFSLRCFSIGGGEPRRM